LALGRFDFFVEMALTRFAIGRLGKKKEKSSPTELMRLKRGNSAEQTGKARPVKVAGRAKETPVLAAVKGRGREGGGGGEGGSASRTGRNSWSAGRFCEIPHLPIVTRRQRAFAA